MGKIYDLVKDVYSVAVIGVALPAFACGVMACGNGSMEIDEADKEVDYEEYTFPSDRGHTVFKMDEEAHGLFKNYLHLRKLQGEERFSKNDVARILYSMDKNGDLIVKKKEIKGYVESERQNLESCMALDSTNKDRSCD